MRRYWKKTLVATVVLSAMISLSLAIERPDLVAPHAEAGNQPSAVCISCHGAKRAGSVDPQTGLREVSLDPDVRTYHAVHTAMGIACTLCHGSVDLLEGSSEHLRKQVNVETCKSCHPDYFQLAGGN